MNFLKRHILDLILLAVIGTVVYSQGPIWLSNYRAEGSILPNVKLLSLDNNDVFFPIEASAKLNSNNKTSKKIYIFWTTWCPSCIRELSKFKTAVNKNDLLTQQIIAINLGEPITTVEKFIKKNEYPFQVLIDQRGDLTSKLNIMATPTIIHSTKDHVISKMTSGSSPLAIRSAKKFLNP